MDEKHTQQFAQTTGAYTSVVSYDDCANNVNYVEANQAITSANSDFLSLLASVQFPSQSSSQFSSQSSQIDNTSAAITAASAVPAATSAISSTTTPAASATTATSATPAASATPAELTTKEPSEEKHRHHLWHRLSSSQRRESKSATRKQSSNDAPHFTPLPNVPQSSSPTAGIFDVRDGQVFDAATRLRLHTLIATCFMNGIADARVHAFMHLLQWQDVPKAVVIAGSFGTTITPDTGPNREPAPTVPPDNTDALRRNIWPQLSTCAAYDAIVERVQTSALQHIAASWRNAQMFSQHHASNTAVTHIAAPSHIILLAVRDNPSEQALEKLCQVFAPSHKPICVSNVAEGVEQIASTLTSTLAAIAVAPAVQHLPQIIHTDDVLPERALIGDATAFDTLYNRVYQSLAPYSNDDPTLSTIDMFLRFGGALDQTAHELNVHPNTVRYRLRKVAQTTGWDATDPRAAYVLQTAITIGRIRDSH